MFIMQAIKITVQDSSVLTGFFVAILVVYKFSCTTLTVLISVSAAWLVYDAFRRSKIVISSLVGILKHYLCTRLLFLVGFFVNRKLQKNTKNVQNVQEKLLLKKLKENENCEYGKLYGFSQISSIREFTERHPLTKYSHYEEYISRMMKGEKGVLTSSEPVRYSVTSGTTGKSSTIPVLKGQVLATLTDGVTEAYYRMASAFPNMKMLQKTLKIFYNSKPRSTPDGVPIGPSSPSPSRMKTMLHMYTTPPAGYDIETEPEALYVHLLFGVKEKSVGMLETNFASILLNSFNMLEFHWDDLVENIETGKIKQSLNIDERVRKKLNNCLKSDPQRADELRDARRRGIVGLAKRIWPDLNIVTTVGSGSNEIYAAKLKDTYLHGVPVYSLMYAASEGLLGVNIWPDSAESRFLLVPSAQVFEFIPVENTGELQPKTLLLHEVELNKDYEIVITNLSCLYRYRLGDVIRVVDFYNQCPVVEFLYRQGQLLNVRAEKTSEYAFYQALNTTISIWPDVTLIDYTCVESGLMDGTAPSGEAPFYHVFLELDGAVVSEDQLNMIDKTLCAQSFVYGSFRQKGSIGPMKVHQVKPGTFEKLRYFMITTSTVSTNQFKVPRVLKRGDTIDFIMNHVIT
ncbi:GH3 domain-containing protein-like [Gigantopelta aegis]|uniref:GH3 domain-containing protein-like n=1 Tax=Gigantopelta aegis TaxID=1735272 RepID=UPI001B888959|nr:GH3 domain-containing protein-like [Gigantopelta aegis]